MNDSSVRPWVAAGAGALVYCGLSAWAAMPVWESAFGSDRSPVSWLSAALLLAIACLAVRLALDASLPRALAAWLAAAVFALALDEQFLLHERWKFGCSALFPPCAWETGGAILRELPLLLVGVVGAITALRLNRYLPSPGQRAGLWTSIAIGLWALAVDQTEMPDAIAVFEEAFEVLAEAVFLGVLLGIRRG